MQARQATLPQASLTARRSMLLTERVSNIELPQRRCASTNDQFKLDPMQKLRRYTTISEQ
jgi:hypothetical protein